MKMFLPLLAILLVFTSCSGSSSLSSAPPFPREEPSSVIVFPAYKEENPQNLPIIDQINKTPSFSVSVDLPDGWTAVPDEPPAGCVVPMGDFHSALYLYNGDELVGYIGFNRFEPIPADIPREEVYKAVYPTLRLSSFFHWDPYMPVKTTDTGETGVADIWYLDPEKISADVPAASTPHLESLGILAYDLEREVFVGIAFQPGAVDREQAEVIAQSLVISSPME